MNIFHHVDWERLFSVHTPLVETFLRGTAVYMALFGLLRLVLKRQQAGLVGVTDLLVVVLLADAAQNAMADDYTSISDGILLVSTIIFWSYVLDWAGYRFPRFERLIHPPPLPLIKGGRLLRYNMRRELVTEEELMSQLREQGIDDVAEVKMAYMEGNGRISVVTYSSGRHGASERRVG